MDNTDLIAKLESASEGSRELSDAVLEACGWEFYQVTGDMSFTAARDPRDGSKMERSLLPCPTTSLDAARALVPEGWDWEVLCEHGQPTFANTYPHTDDIDRTNESEAATPELALCAAVLRSKEQP